LVCEKDCNQKGFSLVELLITLVIVIILTTFFAGSFTLTARRSSLQNEAIAIASRLEMAESLAKSGQSAPQQISQFRIVFDSSTNSYTPEMYNTSGSPVIGWVAAPAISSTPISLGTGISLGSGSITISPTGQPAGAPSQAAEIRFNTRGFPADIVSGTTIAPRADNAVYLTDGKNYYAITVNILGRVQVWYYSVGQWFSFSR